MVENGWGGLVGRTEIQLYLGVSHVQEESQRATKKEMLQALDLASEEVKSISPASFAIDEEEPVDEEVVRNLVDYFVHEVRKKIFERFLTQEEALQVLEGLKSQFAEKPPDRFRIPT